LVAAFHFAGMDYFAYRDRKLSVSLCVFVRHFHWSSYSFLNFQSGRSTLLGPMYRLLV
jgi:hypothetical protein